jgi:hypothetical protein
MYLSLSLLSSSVLLSFFFFAVVYLNRTWYSCDIYFRSLAMRVTRDCKHIVVAGEKGYRSRALSVFAC